MAKVAQLGERQTEDLSVPGSIPGFGTYVLSYLLFFRNRKHLFILFD